MALNLFRYSGSKNLKKPTGDSIWFQKQPDIEGCNNARYEKPTLIICQPKYVLIAGYYRDQDGRNRMVIRKLRSLKDRQKDRGLHDFETVLVYLPEGAVSCIPIDYGFERDNDVEEVLIDVEIVHAKGSKHITSQKCLAVSLDDFSVREGARITVVCDSGSGPQARLEDNLHIKWERKWDVHSHFEGVFSISRSRLPPWEIGSMLWRPLDGGIIVREYKPFDTPVLSRGQKKGTVIIAGTCGPKEHSAGRWFVCVENLSDDFKSFGKSIAFDSYPDFSESGERSSLESVVASKSGNPILVGTEPGKNGKDRGFCTWVQSGAKPPITARLNQFEYRGKTHLVSESFIRGFTSKKGNLFTFGRITEQSGKESSVIFRGKNPSRPFDATFMSDGSCVVDICQGTTSNKLFALVGTGKLDILKSNDDGVSWKKAGQFSGYSSDDLEYEQLIIHGTRYFLICTRWGQIVRGEVYSSSDLKKWSLEKEFLFPESHETRFNQSKYMDGKIFIQGEADFCDGAGGRDDSAAFLLELDLSDEKYLKITVLDSMTVRGGKVLGTLAEEVPFGDYQIRCESGSGMYISKSEIMYATKVIGVEDLYQKTFYQRLIIKALDRKSGTWSIHYIWTANSTPELENVHILLKGKKVHIFGSYSWGCR